MADSPLNIIKWDISDNENAFYCPSPYGSAQADSFQVYMPTMMPLIGGPSRPTQVIGSLSNSCFINDSTCMPSIAKTIRTQNYKTVPMYANRNFAYSRINHGAAMLVEVINKDVHNMYVSNKIDQSYDPY